MRNNKQFSKKKRRKNIRFKKVVRWSFNGNYNNLTELITLFVLSIIVFPVTIIMGLYFFYKWVFEDVKREVYWEEKQDE